MTELPADSRRTKQLRNDVDDLYNILASVETDIVLLRGVVNGHTATLAEHSTTLAEHSTTLAEHGGKLDHIIRLLEAR